MARITEKQREDIRNQLILGESQYSIARDYEVSSATVNKIFKTINEDEFLAKEVKDEIAIKSKLFSKSESIVKAFDTKVNDELRRKNLVYNASEKALVKLTGLIDEVDEAQDMKHIVDAIDKASITLGVNQRHASSAVINNANVQQEVNNKMIVEFK
jgi:hypothetical protein